MVRIFFLCTHASINKKNMLRKSYKTCVVVIEATIIFFLVYNKSSDNKEHASSSPTLHKLPQKNRESLSPRLLSSQIHFYMHACIYFFGEKEEIK